MRPRFEFAFVPCPATGNVDRLDKCYYSQFKIFQQQIAGNLMIVSVIVTMTVTVILTVMKQILWTIATIAITSF